MASDSILVRMGLNNAGFKTGLAKCKAMAANFKASMTSMFRGVGGQIFGALGLSAGVAGLGMLARKAIDTGSAISDMATQLRIGTTELQTLQAIAQKAGITQMDLEKSLRSVQQRTQDALDGNTGYQESFQRLGIDVQAFANLPLEQKMETVARAYKKSGESLEAYSDISTILGTKAGPKMLEVLDKLSSEGFPALQQAAIDGGRVMDEETIASLDRASDEIGKWQNKMIVWFGSFLADMGSQIGRQKWGLMIGLKFAQAGEYIENTLRSAGNYIFASFNSIFRFLNAQFSGFISPIRNTFISFLSTVGNALSKFVGLFSSSLASAVDDGIRSVEDMGKALDELAKKDKGKSFKSLITEEMTTAANSNIARAKNGDNFTSSSVKWYKQRIATKDAGRAAEKETFAQEEAARKARYAERSAPMPKTKSTTEEASKEVGKSSPKSNVEASYLARIGGGGNVYKNNFSEAQKQLTETKKQTELLKQVVTNTQELNGDVLLK